MDARIDRLIDKSHLKSNKQVIAYVKKTLPAATPEQIIARNDRKRDIRGVRLPKKIERHYYYPVFSNHLGGFQVDLLESSKSKKKRKEGEPDDNDVEPEVDEDDMET
jgi:hypothetical protein